MYDIFVISDDVVGRKMAGPGIRAWELSKSLAKHFKVVLGIPDYSGTEEDDGFFKSLSFDVIRYSVEKPELLQKIGVELETLTPEQSKYIDVPIEGPYKPDYYRY